MPLHLTLDTGSPVVSVALARDGAVLASRAVAMERSSSQLLRLIDEVLSETGLRPSDLEGIAALRGPGSFTGLRVGLATALGFHQALGIPATALETLRVLAGDLTREPSGVRLSVVDALRGEWSAQAFAAGPVPRPLSAMTLVSAAGLPALAQAAGPDAAVVGFGASRLAALPGWPRELPVLEAGPLALAAARLAADPSTVWDPALLTSPLYGRPPAVTAPRPRTIPAHAGCA
jgi:tRNA threonylcarbamoyladenosine biosynthesis protein TsaB